MKEIEAWLARDNNGKLYVYNKKPQRLYGIWVVRDFKCTDCLNVDETCFPEVKWSDEEPTKVKLVIDK